MKARSFLTAAVSAVLLAAVPARGDDLAGRISIAVQGGTQSEVSGQLLKAATGSLIGGTAQIAGRSYADVFQPDLRFSASIGYGLNERVEVVVRGTYYDAEAAGLEAGSYDGKPLFAFLAPPSIDTRVDTGERRIKEYGAEVAVRYYLAPQTRLKSYFGAVAGVRVVDDTLVTLSIPEASSALLNVPFSRSGKVPIVGVDLGFGFDVNPESSTNFFVGLDTGLRYQGAAEGYNALSGLTAIDDSDARWSSPVSVVIGVRF